MPCIIYHTSYENELKGKFCPLLEAFPAFANASKEEGKQKEAGKPGEPLVNTEDFLRQKESGQWRKQTALKDSGP